MNTDNIHSVEDLYSDKPLHLTGERRLTVAKHLSAAALEIRLGIRNGLLAERLRSEAEELDAIREIVEGRV